jgi:signal transduction histidine kinase
VRIAVYGPKGALLADSRADTAPAFPDWETIKQRAQRQLPLIRDEDDKAWLYHLTPLEGGRTLLVAAPRQRLPVMTIMREDFLAPFLRGAGIALVLSLLLAFWIAYWVTKPLQRLSKAASEVSKGEFVEVTPSGPREVKAVMTAFNDMGQQVRSNQRSQRDFIANVSHDLKTPLTSIQGFSQAILDGTADDPAAARQAAQVIYDEAGRMHRMVVDLLELARLDAGSAGFQRQPVNLEQMLEQLVEKFKPQAEERGVVLKNLLSEKGDTPAMPVIIGDPDRLDQVFTNLIDNAVKYTPAYGQAEIGGRAIGEWVEIWVADSGPGIPPAELARIFERFYQTDKSRTGGGRRGVGLGLAIASEIVQAHGGTIQAYNRAVSEEDQKPEKDAGAASGSVFLVRLPLARPDDSTLVKRKTASSAQMGEE